MATTIQNINKLTQPNDSTITPTDELAKVRGTAASEVNSAN